jgi:DUF971 family protein
VELHRFDPTPEEIEAGDRDLRVVWSDGSIVAYSYQLLRRSCRCAECVEEMTGRPRLDPSGIPDDVHPNDIRPVGNYAIQIEWSDGHRTGIYSFQHVRGLPGESF